MTAEDRPRTLSGREWAWVGLTALVVCAVKLIFATQRGFWLDEYWTLHAIGLSRWELVEDRLSAGHSPLPFFYVQAFAWLLGTGETALRASSALAAGLATIGVAGLTVQLGLRRLLPTLLALCVVIPYWHRIGTELRYMMPLVAVSAFWMWAMVAHIGDVGEGRQGRASRVAWAAALLGGLALWWAMSAQLVLVALLAATALMLPRFGWRLFARAASPLWISLLISAPLIVALSLMPTRDVAMRDMPDAVKALQHQVQTFFGAKGLIDSGLGIPSNGGYLVMLSLYIAALYATWRFLRREQTPMVGKLLLGMLAGVPIAVMVCTLAVDDVQGPVRYVAVTSVPLLIVFAIAWREWGSMGRVGVGLRVVFIVITGTMFGLEIANEGDGHRGAVRWIVAQHRSGDPVYTVGKLNNRLALHYHGLPASETVDGSPSSLRYEAAVRERMEACFGLGDVGFVLLYHWDADKSPVVGILEEMRASGWLKDFRHFSPTAEVQVYAVARTEAGEQRIAGLGEMESPRVTDVNEE